MNDCTFYLDAPLLKAALLFVANGKDSRERLRCVHVYSNGPTVITESTNGHAALIGRNTYENVAFRGPGAEGGLNVSINAIDVKAALDTGDGNLVPLVSIDGVWALGGINSPRLRRNIPIWQELFRRRAPGRLHSSTQSIFPCSRGRLSCCASVIKVLRLYMWHTTATMRQ